jgi:predicted PurR-regulated permease PerM
MNGLDQRVTSVEQSAGKVMEQSAGGLRGDEAAAHFVSTAAALASAVNEDGAEELRRPVASARGASFGAPGWVLGGLMALAVVYTLYFARQFLLPIAMALLLTGLLRPLVSSLVRRRLPQALAAGLVVLGAILATSVALYNLAGPAASWLRRAPGALDRFEQKVRIVTAPLDHLAQAADRMSRLVHMRSAEARGLEVGDLSFDWLGLTQQVAFELVVTLMLLYFLLASGDFFFRQLLAVLPRAIGRHRVEVCAVEIEKQISVYLVTVTSINFCLGGAASFALWLLGVPNPVLWGALLGVATYVPYIGPVVAIVIIGGVALISIDDLMLALAAPLACASLSLLEGYVVTPVVVGRSLALNPLVVFLALIFWSWLWGIAGAIMAVPLLVTGKILCDNIRGLGPLGRVLGSYREKAGPLSARP